MVSLKGILGAVCPKHSCVFSLVTQSRWYETVWLTPDPPGPGGTTSGYQMTARLSPIRVCGFHGHLSLRTIPSPVLS